MGWVPRPRSRASTPPILSRVSKLFGSTRLASWTMVDHGEAVGTGSMSIMILKISIRCRLESIRCCARSVIGQVIKVRNEDVCAGQATAQKIALSRKSPSHRSVTIYLSACWQSTHQRSALILSSPTSDNLNLLQCPSNPLFLHLNQNLLEKQGYKYHYHPGIPDRALPRRSSVEVENERVAKAQAMAARQVKKRWNIRRAVEFKSTDMTNESIADATP